eukprot:CAMPEP_0204918572 /NCGR_PEP_ID=MMETSP1397-20131031/16238_1 /ASSEMBLY_ACC=CAM_ASM_000891 /TAXON_ID=49980 /ORGANISM="Climacostomum Climacostomum virens, Strain Stock W-24" /LENGTH=950 /DNA_ID=CAMNT_0052091901 /DNA_START=48 /DNA_END=2900 /DNA_ORIENTATION=-
MNPAKPTEGGYTQIETEADEVPLLLPSPDVPREYEEINTRLIRITRPFRTKWDLFLMVLALYVCITVPMQVAFEEKETIALFTVNTIIDFIFLGDIVLNFFTTFINSNGDEVTDLKVIGKHYLRTYFLIDFCGSFPIDNFYNRYSGGTTAGQILTLSDLLKLIRILRLGRIIRFMRAKDETKALIKLAQVALYLLIWVHLTGCLYYAVVTRNEEWIPVPDFVTGTTNLYESDLLRKYVTAYYHGMWLLKGNEVGPIDTESAMLGAICTILGSLITAILFGEMAVLMSNLNRRETHFQSILDSTLTTMENMKLPKQLCNKILDYILATQHSLSAQEEYETFQKYISPRLQSQVSICVFDPVVKSNKILKHEAKTSEFIVQKLQNLFTKPEEEIVIQGTDAEELYFIASGEVKVFVMDETQEKKFVCFLGKGAHFGEIALVYHTPRTATVESVGYSNVALLVKKDYETLISRHPHILEKFRSATTQYDDPWKKYLLEILFQAEYFENLNPDVFQELAYLMQVKKYEPGAYIFKPGDLVQDIIIIADGKAELSFTMNERHLHMLKKQVDAKNIEESPRIPKTSKNLDEFYMYNFPMNVFGNLKTRAEMVPVENSKGICGAILLGDVPPESTTRLGDYPQEVLINTLESGTMLCHNLVLMEEYQQLQLKALKTTTVYTLNISILSSIANEHSDFASALKKTKMKLFKHDFERNSSVKHFSPLDYVTIYDSGNECRYQWKANIIKVIRDNRENRLKGCNQLLKLVPKINAILSCEAAGNLDLADRVAKDEIPPHYITEDGNLDRAAISSNDPSVIPNSHPVLQLFRKIYNDVSQPEGSISSQYDALERIVMQQNRQLNMFRREILEMKNRLGPFVGRAMQNEASPPLSDRGMSKLPSIAKDLDKGMLKIDIEAVTKSNEDRRKKRKELKSRQSQELPPVPEAENQNLLDMIRSGQ